MSILFVKCVIGAVGGAFRELPKPASCWQFETVVMSWVELCPCSNCHDAWLFAYSAARLCSHDLLCLLPKTIEFFHSFLLGYGSSLTNLLGNLTNPVTLSPSAPNTAHVTTYGVMHGLAKVFVACRESQVCSVARRIAEPSIWR